MTMSYQGDHSKILFHYPSNNGKKSVLPILKIRRSTHLNRGSSEGASSSKISPDNVGIVKEQSTTLGPCTPLPEPSHRFIKRNSEDLNDDHLLNNGLEQRVDRQSPPPVEKNAEAVGCFSPNAIVTTRSVSKNLRNSTPSNTQACAPPDKIDMETFQWPRIFLQLSWKEKEEDFLIMKGTKPSKRPKKRPKHVEKVVQNCCPGSWLSNIGKGRYDVRK